MMTQSIVVKPASYALKHSLSVTERLSEGAPQGDTATHISFRNPLGQENTCSTCPYFNNFHEPNGRGWCELFNQQARAHHKQTNDCITSSDLIVSHELEDNLSVFPDVDFEELKASHACKPFVTKELEDELDQHYSKYQTGSIVKVIDADENHTEWAVFEIIDCRAFTAIQNRI